MAIFYGDCVTAELQSSEILMNHIERYGFISIDSLRAGPVPLTGPAGAQSHAAGEARPLFTGVASVAALQTLGRVRRRPDVPDPG